MSAPDKNKVHFLKFGAHRSVEHAAGWFRTSKLRHPALARQHLLHALMHRRDECGLAGVALAVSEARGVRGWSCLGLSGPLGMAHVRVAATSISFRRNAWNHPGTIPEPSEASRETPMRVGGTIRNHRRNHPDFEEAPRETSVSWRRPVFYLKF